MLPQKNRLRKKRDIEITFEEGRFVGGNVVNMKVWKIDPEKYKKRGYSGTELQFAFVCGVKVERRAVKRNRLKRQMREVVRLLLKDQVFPAGYFVLVMAKREMLEADFSEIQADMIRVFKKARLFV